MMLVLYLYMDLYYICIWTCIISVYVWDLYYNIIGLYVYLYMGFVCVCVYGTCITSVLLWGLYIYLNNVHVRTYVCNIYVRM